MNGETTGSGGAVARRLVLGFFLLAALSSMLRGSKPPQPTAVATRAPSTAGPLTVTARVNVALPVIVSVHCPSVPLDLGASAPPKDGRLKALFTLDEHGKDNLFVELNAPDYQPKLLGPYHLESSAISLDLGDVKLEKQAKLDTSRGPEAMRNPEVLKSLHVIDKEQVIKSGAPTLPRTTHLPQFGPTRPMGVKR